MDALEALLTRQSSSRLAEPAPDGQQRDAIFRAALTAADHAALRPWRFLVVEGDARVHLGEKMMQAEQAANPDMDDAKREKLLAAPLRAPLLIIAIANYQPHPKVPEIEQQFSAGAAVTQMQLAIHAQGYASIWRTGSVAFNRRFMDDMGLSPSESIVGFLYVGTADGRQKTARALEPSDYFRSWAN